MPSHRAIALLTLVATLSALPTGLASASCAFDPRPIAAHIEDAEIAFKGQVIGLTEDRRTARFDVDEVWKGDVATEVVVHGGPEQPMGAGDVATSVDRHWDLGATYLVFPQRDGDTYRDNSCSATTTWQATLADARPDDWHEPVAAGDEGDGAGMDVPVGLLIAVGVATLAVLAVAIIGRIRG